MIMNYANKQSAAIAAGKALHIMPQELLRVVARKLAMIEAAHVITDLRIPPGNRLEQLKGNRAGQWSIRINDKYRICFRWIDGHAHDVEIVDYH